MIFVVLKEKNMKSRLDALEIPSDNPFQNCKLDREKYAKVLTDIVMTYKDGCVLALNGKWGTGKTTFVNMWQQSLVKEEFVTINFNAWKNDFISDPIIGLVGELKDSIKEMKTPEEQKMIITPLINTTAKLISKNKLTLIKGILKSFTNEDIVDSFEDTSLYKKQIDEYSSQKDAMEAFQSELTKIVNEIVSHSKDEEKESKPLVYIIDELDRCAPSYAVKVLERIKHLFSIPNVVFVLSIDKEQLAHSICGFYGSECINAEEYLKRFIDIEYSLPEPHINKFVDYLCEYYQFRLLNSASIRCFIEDFLYPKKVTLRQVEKIFAHTRLSLQMFKDEISETINIDMFMILVYYNVCEPDVYTKICSKEYSIQDLIKTIENGLRKDKVTNMKDLSDTVSLLISFYYEGDAKEIKWDNITFEVLDEDKIKSNCTGYKSEYYKSQYLSFFTDKIDLLDNFTY